jgi:methyl-accepting chemotaxis protein
VNSGVIIKFKEKYIMSNSVSMITEAAAEAVTEGGSIVGGPVAIGLVLAAAVGGICWWIFGGKKLTPEEENAQKLADLHKSMENITAKIKASTDAMSANSGALKEMTASLDEIKKQIDALTPAAGLHAV